jgi:hypothetical protein
MKSKSVAARSHGDESKGESDVYVNGGGRRMSERQRMPCTLGSYPVANGI